MAGLPGTGDRAAGLWRAGRRRTPQERPRIQAEYKHLPCIWRRPARGIAVRSTARPPLPPRGRRSAPARSSSYWTVQDKNQDRLSTAPASTDVAERLSLLHCNDAGRTRPKGLVINMGFILTCVIA